jgi:hypothetical protein
MKPLLTGTMLALAITAAEAVEDPINTSPYVTTAILDDCEALADGRASDSIFEGILCRGINLGSRLWRTVRALSGSFST